MGILSTKSGGKLTAQQHASQMERSGIKDVILRYGTEFNPVAVGLTISIGSGMANIGGRTAQFTSTESFTITPNRLFRIIIRVNLATGTAIMMKQEDTGSLPPLEFQGDLINNLSAVRDFEIGNGVSSSTNITFSKTAVTKTTLEEDFDNKLLSYQKPRITSQSGAVEDGTSVTDGKTLQQYLTASETGLRTIYAQNSSPIANDLGTDMRGFGHKFLGGAGTLGYGYGIVFNSDGLPYTIQKWNVGQTPFLRELMSGKNITSTFPSGVKVDFGFTRKGSIVKINWQHPALTSEPYDHIFFEFYNSSQTKITNIPKYETRINSASTTRFNETRNGVAIRLNNAGIAMGSMEIVVGSNGKTQNDTLSTLGTQEIGTLFSNFNDLKFVSVIGFKLADGTAHSISNHVVNATVIY